MSTSQTLNSAVEHVEKLLGEKLTKKVYIRSATPGKTNGRCLFDFTNNTNQDLALAVVCGKKGPTGYYVVPGHNCPKVLLVRPGSEDSKWHPYYCADPKALAALVQSTLDFKPSKRLLNRLSVDVA